jgi:hypothetical protein
MEIDIENFRRAPRLRASPRHGGVHHNRGLRALAPINLFDENWIYPHNSAKNLK